MYYSMIASPFHDRGILDDPPLPANVSFIGGSFIEWTPAKPLVFRSNCDEENPPRHCMAGIMPVWSEQLLNAVLQTGAHNIQAFAAIITNDSDGKEWLGYFAINVVGMVSAASLKASTAVKIGQHPAGSSFMGFQTLVLDSARTRNKLMFRLAENPLLLIVHEQVIQRLRETAPPEGWGITVDEVEEKF